MDRPVISPELSLGAACTATPGRFRPARLLPGTLLSVTIGSAALSFSAAEQHVYGTGYAEPLIVAILAGALIASVRPPSDRYAAGIDFSAKYLLELAIVLLGCSFTATALMAIRPALLAGIVAIVILSILLGFGMARLLGLPPRLAILIACGNAICGNSAIMSVAPVVGARGAEISAAVAFTAVFGIATVMGLPLLGAALHLAPIDFGILAGLTVYAVPQVLAAAAPMGQIAVQSGTLVKLVRVLMLGPVCLILSLAMMALNRRERPVRWRHSDVAGLVPWFILGFLAMLGVRSCGLVPLFLLRPIGDASTMLAAASMAALGLRTDLRAVTGAGGRTIVAVCLSFLLLCALALALIHILPASV